MINKKNENATADTTTKDIVETQSQIQNTVILPETAPNVNGESNQSTLKTFNTIDGNTLMAMDFEPLGFAVEKILPFGLYIKGGSPKSGKSLLALEIAIAVVTGGMMWHFSAEQGDVLYLALEDNYLRLQDRLVKMEADGMDISRLHFEVVSPGINNGLLEYVRNFLLQYPNTRLIIIDTLQHIRDGEFDKNMYSYDYRDMMILREITNNHKLTCLLIHHTRKMYDPDPLNTLSGSTGLIGAVDGVFVLAKDKRIGNKATLSIVNRDTESFCFKIELNPVTLRWEFIDNISDYVEDEEPLCSLIDDFIRDNWNGSASELLKELRTLDCAIEYTPATLTKKLKASNALLKKDYGLVLSFERKNSGKIITITRHSDN